MPLAFIFFVMQVSQQAKTAPNRRCETSKKYVSVHFGVPTGAEAADGITV
jgi:hypothetical protein